VFRSWTFLDDPLQYLSFCFVAGLTYWDEATWLLLVFLYSPIVGQITLGSFKLLCFVKWHWLLASYVELDVLQSWNVFVASKKCLYFVKNELPCFLFFVMTFVFLLCIFHKILGTHRHFVLGFWCYGSFSSPVTHWHQDTAVFHVMSWKYI